jgi:putative lipoprotein
MTGRLLPLPFLLVFALAHAQSERVAYTCDDGSRFAAEFMTGGAGRPQATLFIAGGEITLPLVPAASGALYRDGNIRLHTKGTDATFEDGKGPLRRCTSGDPPPPAAPAPSAASSFVAIAGSVDYLARGTLPPDAVLIVRIQDTSRAGAPALQLAEQRIELAGRASPIPFQVIVDRDLIGPRARVTAAGRIESRRKLLYISDAVTPAIIDRKPVAVELKLVPVGPRKR